jgi:flagellar hook-basal body complex protein FliE
MESKIEITNLRDLSSSQSADHAPSVSDSDIAHFQSAFARYSALHSSESMRNTSDAAISPSVMQNSDSQNVIQQGLDHLFKASTEMSENSARIKDKLVKTGKTGDPVELSQVMLEMSEQSLATQYMAKIISKCTTAVDQLTKMQ